MEVLNSLLPHRNIGLTCCSSQFRRALPYHAALQSQVGFTHRVSDGFEGWQGGTTSMKRLCAVPRSSGNSNNTRNDFSDQNKTPFGYSRKDVILIGVGVTAAGWGLKSGLEYLGVDPLQAGNVVQLVIVLGLTVGWISTYLFRVSNKEMTYAQQLRDYESKVMEKRLESLTEAELEALLEQVEEEKRRIGRKEKTN